MSKELLEQARDTLQQISNDLDTRARLRGDVDEDDIATLDLGNSNVFMMHQTIENLEKELLNQSDSTPLESITPMTGEDLEEIRKYVTENHCSIDLGTLDVAIGGYQKWLGKNCTMGNKISINREILVDTAVFLQFYLLLLLKEENLTGAKPLLLEQLEIQIKTNDSLINKHLLHYDEPNTPDEIDRVLRETEDSMSEKILEYFDELTTAIFHNELSASGLEKDVIDFREKLELLKVSNPTPLEKHIHNLRFTLKAVLKMMEDSSINFDYETDEINRVLRETESK